MSAIEEFIEARIAEDEQTARTAGERAMKWRSYDGAVSGGPFEPADPEWGIEESGTHTIVYDEGWPLKSEAAHIARMDPERAVREVDGKRAIVAECASILEVDGWEYTDAPNLAWLTLYGLAAAWADHPDYDQDWALVDAEEKS
ncbi:DUF6221 family protein [Nocardia spumae]|uniref:DUF6221 family protein n=1 Tax=Nocardia spumae TaxID=2887190 RepID=UPI001D142790|nr:DUF6221 family protein [Nocardia spumae]